MQFNHDQDLDSYTVRAYGSDYVEVLIPQSQLPVVDSAEPRVRTERLTDSFIMCASQLLRDWVPRSLDELQHDHFESVLVLEPEVVILGTGASLTFPDMALMSRFMEQGIGFEVMDTAAACRTYNILVNEGRRVVAAVLL